MSESLSAKVAAGSFNVIETASNASSATEATSKEPTMAATSSSDNVSARLATVNPYSPPISNRNSDVVPRLVDPFASSVLITVARIGSDEEDNPNWLLIN